MNRGIWANGTRSVRRSRSNRFCASAIRRAVRRQGEQDMHPPPAALVVVLLKFGLNGEGFGKILPDQLANRLERRPCVVLRRNSCTPGPIVTFGEVDTLIFSLLRGVWTTFRLRDRLVQVQRHVGGRPRVIIPRRCRPGCGLTRPAWACRRRAAGFLLAVQPGCRAAKYEWFKDVKRTNRYGVLAGSRNTSRKPRQSSRYARSWYQRQADQQSRGEPLHAPPRTTRPFVLSLCIGSLIFPSWYGP